MKKISYVVILAAALALGCWWLDRAGILSLKPAGGLSLGQLGTALAAATSAPAWRHGSCTCCSRGVNAPLPRPGWSGG